VNAPQQLDAATRAALDGLADIATPAPVSWMPHTWGWVALAVVAAGATAVLLWRWRRRSLANRYRREALQLLAALERRALDPSTRGAALVQIAELVKRTALAAYSRPVVARLSGAAWVEFLRGNGAGVANPAVALFDDLEYRSADALAATTDGDAKAIAGAARDWIKGHRVPA
jgi:hypothetical protein